jgi:hypothetical protein
VTAAHARATGHRGFSRTRASPLMVLNSDPAMAQVMGATDSSGALPTTSPCCGISTAGVCSCQAAICDTGTGSAPRWCRAGAAVAASSTWKHASTAEAYS